MALPTLSELQVEYERRRAEREGEQPAPPAPTRVPEQYSILQRQSQELHAQKFADQMDSIQAVSNIPVVREPWDYKTAVLGPNNEALPSRAIGWDPHERPDYGPGIGGIVNRVLTIFEREETRETGDVYAPWDDPILKEGIATAMEAGEGWAAEGVSIESLGEGLKGYGALLGSIVEYGARTIQNVWTGLEDVSGIAEPIGYIARGMGGGATAIAEVFTLAAQEYERAIGPAYLASNEIIARSYESRSEEMPEWVDYLHDVPFIGAPIIMLGAKLVQEAGEATLEDYRNLEKRYATAGRIAYTAASDHIVREEYIRRVNAGEDPRLLAMELGHPGKEMLGQMMNDPMFFVEIINSKIKGAKALAKNRGIYATVSDPTMIDNMAIMAISGGDNLSAAAADDIVNTTRQMYNNARASISEMARKSGFFSLTSGGKQTDAMGRMSNFIQGLFAHSKQNIDETMDILKGIVLAADPEDAARSMEGLDAIASAMRKSGLTVDVAMSTAGNETAVILREILVDDAGKFNIDWILKQLGESPSAADVGEAFANRLDNVLEDLFPNVGQRVEQNAEYARLLAETPDEAAAYLASHPAADQVVSPIHQAIDNAHQAAQKWFYRPVASVQGTLYMSASPAYRIRNRIGNSVSAFVEQGVEGIKNLLPASVQDWFGFGPKNALDDIARWTGGQMPEGAVRGIGAAGGGPVDISKGILGRFNQAAGAAGDEAAAAANVMAKSVRDSMRKMLKDGRAFDTSLLASLADDQRSLMSRLMVEHYGDADAAADAYRAAATGGRNVGRNLDFLDEASLKRLDDLGLYDEAVRRTREIDLLDDVERSLDELADEYQTIGQSTAREGAFTDLSDESGIGRVVAETSSSIEENVGKIEADLFERGNIANEEAVRTITQVADDVEGLARVNITVDFETSARAAGQPPRAGVEAAETYIDEIIKPFTKDFDKRIDDTFVDARQFTRDTREYTKLSKRRGRDLRRMWYDAQLPGHPPDGLTGQQFRDALWDNYYPTQNTRFINLREDRIAMNRVRAEALASHADLSPEELLARLEPARIAHSNARMFDIAEIAPDGTAYARLHPVSLVVDADRRYAQIATEFGLTSGENDVSEAIARVVEKEFSESDMAVYGTRGRMLYDQDAVIQELATEYGARYDMESVEFLDNLIDELEGIAQADFYDLEKTPFRLNLVTPADAGTPSTARVFHETSPVARAAIDELKQGLRDNWGRLQDVQLNPQIERELREFVLDARGKVTEARNIAVGVATDTRDFVLHNYGKRYGFDLVASYIYPYQFWHSRTYIQWMKRLLSNPYIVASYGRWRENREATHAGYPDWWKYNVSSDELLGIETEHPMFFNLEASLNPLNGMTGVDFNDPIRRQDWFSSTLDDFNKIGPSVWTPYQLAIALYYHEQGQDDVAARWAGRLYTPTRTFRDVTALMGLEEGKGIELDPFINYFGGGIGPYERNRIGRMLSSYVNEGRYSEAEIIDAGYAQEGPIWDEAHAEAVNLRAPNLWQIAAPFMLGSGFKPRTQSDIEIDRFWGEVTTLFNSKPLMSPEEYRQSWDTLEQRYNFMDVLLLSRKSGIERDEALAWTTLGRIPPGQMDEIAEMVGVTPEMIDAFYDSKGELAAMNDSDRMHFMAAILDIGALLDLPDAASKVEWDAARARYRGLMDAGEDLFGDDIWTDVDTFYASEDKDAYLRNHPVVEQALDWKQGTIMTDPLLAAYYTSAERIEKYFKGQMYDQAEELFGEDLWDHWDVYSQLSDMDNKAARKYFKDHPQLKTYLEFRDDQLLVIAELVAKFGAMIPEAAPVRFREEQEEEEISLDQDKDAWIRAQVMSYLAGGEGVPQVPQNAVPELLRATLGDEAARLYMDYIYLGIDMPQALVDQLKELGIEH